MTTNDNKWYREWQLVTTSGETSDDEWEQVTTGQSESQRVVILVKVPFASNALVYECFKNKKVISHYTRS